MFNHMMDAIGALCAIVLVWCLVRPYLRKTRKTDQSDPIAIEDYLQKITLITGFSVYDTFHKSAEDWHVSADRIDKDFAIYLSSQSIPYYVKDFVRKSQRHIDELYRGKGSNFVDKRLVIFFFFLTLFFWGGAVFLSLYVIPHILPEEFRAMFFYGPP